VISDRNAVYRIFRDADLLLYISASKVFGTRWKQHAKTQPWWGEHRRMTVEWHDTRDEALDAEAIAIFSEQPKYNVLHHKQAQRHLRAGARVASRPKPKAEDLVVPG
jgi:hypothetical protein